MFGLDGTSVVAVVVVDIVSCFLQSSLFTTRRSQKQRKGSCSDMYFGSRGSEREREKDDRGEKGVVTTDYYERFTFLILLRNTVTVYRVAQR